MNQSHGFLEALPEAGLAWLYDHWRSFVLENGRLPYRTEIDPLDVPKAVLPNMLIIEKVAGGRFRCRLAGTRLREVYGFEIAGRYLDDVMSPAASADRIKIYERVLDERCAAYCRLRFAVPGREFVASDRLYVPVLDRQSSDPMVLFCVQRFVMSAEIVGHPDAAGVYTLRFDDTVLPLT
ncbi:MAG: PAS domain-containing protein [Thalassobaculaceae bacterium]